MRRSILNTTLMIAVFYIAAVLPTKAVSPDPRILSLVSPHAGILAGIRASPTKEQPSSCLLIVTHKDKIDMEDFIALSGVDSFRSIHEILLEATPDGTHSMLASGHFDRELIYRSALSTGATRSAYRGIDVLSVEPFPRERGELDEVRWLAIVNADIALFGTIADVREELDRYLSHSSAEPIFSKSLARLRKDDDPWSMLRASSGSTQTPDALRLVEPKLPVFIPMGSTLEFGMRYGSHVELDYDVSPSSESDVQTTIAPLSRSLPVSISMASSFLAAPADSPVEGSAHGEIKISRAQYDAWMAKAAALRNSAMPLTINK